MYSRKDSGISKFMRQAILPNVHLLEKIMSIGLRRREKVVNRDVSASAPDLHP